jgi:hypothetical protein
MKEEKTRKRPERPADWRAVAIGKALGEEFAGFGDWGEYPEWRPDEVSGAAHPAGKPVILKQTDRPDRGSRSGN